MKYQGYTYDVWGNEEDGYEVNNVSYTGEDFDIPEDATDAEIVRCINGLNITVDPGIGDEETLYLISTIDGKPIGELRRTPQEGWDHIDTSHD